MPARPRLGPDLRRTWDATLGCRAQSSHRTAQHPRRRADGGAHALALGGDGALTLPNPLAPITFKVGPLYGEPAQVAVARAAPHEMPWLQLRTGTRGLFAVQAPPTGDIALGPPTTIGGGPSAGIGGAATSHQVTGDDQQVVLTTGDDQPGPGQAHVYRVTATQQGQVFGGYTVVLLGPPAP